MSITAMAQGWGTENITVDASVWTGDLDTDGAWHFGYVGGVEDEWEVTRPDGSTERVTGSGWMPRQLRHDVLRVCLGEEVGDEVYYLLEAQAT